MGTHTLQLRLRIKAVPGASRDSVSGLLGDRLKVRVSAAPEGGRANIAIVKLLFKALGVQLVSGHTNPEKVFMISAQSVVQLSEALGFDVSPAIA
jgi:uncharacterized protein (TIGR00251 family)